MGNSRCGKKVLGPQAKFLPDKSETKLARTGPKQRAGCICTADEEKQECGEVMALYSRGWASP